MPYQQDDSKSASCKLAIIKVTTNDANSTGKVTTQDAKNHQLQDSHQQGDHLWRQKRQQSRCLIRKVMTKKRHLPGSHQQGDHQECHLQISHQQGNHQGCQKANANGCHPACNSQKPFKQKACKLQSAKNLQKCFQHTGAENKPANGLNSQQPRTRNKESVWPTSKVVAKNSSH